jgi:aspartate racemase
MKTIGLLGGMSWESTSQYYRLINEQIRQQLGGLHSAKISLFSVDFDPLEKQMRSADWQACVAILQDGARRVAAAGADFLLLCTNTLHKLAAEIETAIDIPFIHIIDATAEQIVDQNIKRIGLLGTRFTMEESFYTERLQRYNIATIVPSSDDRAIVDRVIFNELCLGQIKEPSKDEYLRIIKGLVDWGAEAIIAGCTEIPLLVPAEECPVPFFDTTALHAAKAVQLALEG